MKEQLYTIPLNDAITPMTNALSALLKEMWNKICWILF